jgi:hypothetical protein
MCHCCSDLIRIETHGVNASSADDNLMRAEISDSVVVRVSMVVVRASRVVLCTVMDGIQVCGGFLDGIVWLVEWCDGGGRLHCGRCNRVASRRNRDESITPLQSSPRRDHTGVSNWGNQIGIVQANTRTSTTNDNAHTILRTNSHGVRGSMGDRRHESTCTHEQREKKCAK